MCRIGATHQPHAMPLGDRPAPQVPSGRCFHILLPCRRLTGPAWQVSPLSPSSRRLSYRPSRPLRWKTHSQESTVEVVLICAGGYLLASNGILDKPSQRSLSLANLYFSTPALIFVKLGGQLRWDVVVYLWALPVLVAILIGFPIFWREVNERCWVRDCSCHEPSGASRSKVGEFRCRLYNLSECMSRFRVLSSDGRQMHRR